MKRGRVVDTGADARQLESVLYRSSYRDADREQVVDARRRATLCEQADVSVQHPAVGQGVATPRRVCLVQAAELDAEEGGLDAVEAVVVPGNHVLTLAPLPHVAQPARGLGDARIVGAQRTAVPERPEVLARVERECRAGTEAAGRATAAGGAMRLRGVFDERQAMTRRESLERWHVGELAIQVHGDHRRR